MILHHLLSETSENHRLVSTSNSPGWGNYLCALSTKPDSIPTDANRPQFFHMPETKPSAASYSLQSELFAIFFICAYDVVAP